VRAKQNVLLRNSAFHAVTRNGQMLFDAVTLTAMLVTKVTRIVRPSKVTLKLSLLHEFEVFQKLSHLISGVS